MAKFADKQVELDGKQGSSRICTLFGWCNECLGDQFDANGKCCNCAIKNRYEVALVSRRCVACPACAGKGYSAGVAEFWGCRDCLCTGDSRIAAARPMALSIAMAVQFASRLVGSFLYAEAAE